MKSWEIFYCTFAFCFTEHTEEPGVSWVLHPTDGEQDALGTALCESGAGHTFLCHQNTQTDWLTAPAPSTHPHWVCSATERSAWEATVPIVHLMKQKQDQHLVQKRYTWFSGWREKGLHLKDCEICFNLYSSHWSCCSQAKQAARCSQHTPLEPSMPGSCLTWKHSHIPPAYYGKEGAAQHRHCLLTTHWKS